MHTPMELFEMLSAIPRVSGNERAAADFVQAHAQGLGLPFVRDNMDNIIVCKPAAKGWEDADTVMIQGHLDMVGEAAPGVDHDFARDGITLMREGDILRGDGTTLGADDGVAVAYMLALLEEDSLAHPRLECVFTVQEEIGLLGAMALDTSSLQAKRMINLDAGPEGVLLTTCAGGCRAKLRKPLSQQPIQGSGWRIVIDRLKGGHSAQLQDGRANALMLAGMLADNLRGLGGRMVSLSAGDKDNVIPASATFTMALPMDPRDALAQLIEEIRNAWAHSDPNLRISLSPAENGSQMLSLEDSDTLIDLLLCLPCGIDSYCQNFPGLPETSANLASAHAEGAELTMGLSLRSSVDLKKHRLLRRIERLAAMHGCAVVFTGIYPGWPHDPASPLREICVDVYKEIYGEEPAVEGIHAGLECGVFKAKMPWLDIVATGPLYKEMHTPNEWLDCQSFDRTYRYLCEVLGALTYAGARI